MAAELRAEHARTEDVLESIGEAFYAVDSQFRFTYVNRKAEEFWERRREDLVGRHYWTEFPLAVGSEAYHMHLRAMEDRRPARFEAVSPVVVRWLDVSLFPEASGGLSCYFTDVTARKEAEAALRRSASRWRFLARLSDVLRGSGEAARVAGEACSLLADELGLVRCTYALVDIERGVGSVQAEASRGMPSVMGEHRLSDFGVGLWASSAAGETAVNRDVALDPTTAAECGAYERMGTRSFVHVPLLRNGRLVAFLDAHAGEPREWSEIDVNLVQDAASRLWEAFQRTAAEVALRDLNEGLELRIGERTSDLTRANRDLDQFAYSVAHDLRGPLRNIVATSRMLIEDAEDRLHPEEADLLRRQAANGVRLAQIVDDLLGFARLAQAEPRKAVLDITALARKTADQARATRASTCEVEVQEGLSAQGDPSLVGYVLANLLDNSLKFSPEGGRVSVGEEGGTFFVRDQGVGFDMAHAGKLFTAFERLVGQSQFEGTGVGLANVRRIVEKHGGRVWAESEPGKGSTFWFTLE